VAPGGTPLGADQRDRYGRDWRKVQADFVDDPPGAIGEADRLDRKSLV
jgi:hypothetical protein